MSWEQVYFLHGKMNTVSGKHRRTGTHRRHEPSPGSGQEGHDFSQEQMLGCAMETEWCFFRQGSGRRGARQRRPTEQRLSIRERRLFRELQVALHDREELRLCYWAVLQAMTKGFIYLQETGSQ